MQTKKPGTSFEAGRAPEGPPDSFGRFQKALWRFQRALGRLQKVLEGFWAEDIDLQ